MKNTGDEELTMYVVSEPTPANFVPAKANAGDGREPSSGQNSDGCVAVHASRRFRTLGPCRKRSLLENRRLATIGDLITVTIDPMTMGEPHPHNPGQEEIWAAIDGNSLAFIGTELRVQRPGMAYMIRPDQSMTHSNINSSDTPVKVPLVLRQFLDQEVESRLNT